MFEPAGEPVQYIYVAAIELDVGNRYRSPWMVGEERTVKVMKYSPSSEKDIPKIRTVFNIPLNELGSRYFIPGSFVRLETFLI